MLSKVGLNKWKRRRAASCKTDFCNRGSRMERTRSAVWATLLPDFDRCLVEPAHSDGRIARPATLKGLPGLRRVDGEGALVIIARRAERQGEKKEHDSESQIRRETSSRRPSDTAAGHQTVLAYHLPWPCDWLVKMERMLSEQSVMQRSSWRCRSKMQNPIIGKARVC